MLTNKNGFVSLRMEAITRSNIGEGFWAMKGKWKWKSMIVALIAGLMVIPATAMAAEVKLTDFEYGSNDDLNKDFSLWQDTGIGIKWSLGTTSVNDGKKSVKVEPTGDGKGWNVLIYTLPENAHKNWSDSEAVSFWIHNTSDKNFTFAFEMDDANDSVFEVKTGKPVYLKGTRMDSFNKFTTVPAGFKGTVKIPLDSLKNVDWQGGDKVFDPSNVKTLKIGYDPSVFDGTFYLDSYVVHTKGAAASGSDGGSAADPGTAAGSGAGNPKTGDSGMATYLALAVISGLAALLVLRKSRSVKA